MRFRLSCLLVFPFAAACAAPPSQAPREVAPIPAAGRAANPSAPHGAPAGYRPGIDVVDYDLTLDLPESGAMIRGRAVLTVRRTAPVDSLTLDLVGPTVDSALVDGRPVVFARTARTLTLPLPSSGDQHVVTIRYGGVVEDGLVVRTDSAGRWTGFGDNWPDRARLWIPSVDHPSDKATVTWRVRAPAGRTVVANGLLMQSVADEDGFTRTVWRESRPIPTYLMVIAAAPLAPYPLGETACGLAEHASCVPQVVYTAPEQAGVAPGEFARAGEIVSWFARMVGPFPYEKLAHLQSSTRFGGMENASAIFYADGVFRRTGPSEALIAHETAHQWFGDAVTEREWPHLWLSEGFATYFAALFAEHAHGPEAFRTRMSEIRRTVLDDRRSVPTRPVIDTIETDLLALLNRNSYEKGGFVLHMLRREVGDSAFFRGLRAYYAAHRHGTVLTDDLRRAMEAASGRPLDWFFDQWLRRPGHPELRITWRRAGDGSISLAVAQSARFGAYRFPLTVAVVRPGGVVDRATLRVPAVEHAELRLPGSYASDPARIDVDPDVDLLATIQLTRGR